MVYTRLVAYVNRRGLNRSSRERERDDFRHSVDGHFTQRAYIGEWTRTSEVWPRASTGHDDTRCVWKCVNTEYVCQYTEETSENSFQCLIQRCTRAFVFR